MIGITTRYVQNNTFSLVLLLLCMICGWTSIFGFTSAKPWEAWKISAFGYTLAYTAYIYFNGFKKGYFASISGPGGIFIGAAFIALAGVLVATINDRLHFFNFEMDTEKLMFMLLVTAVIFITVDVILLRDLQKSHSHVSECYKLSLKFSDIPTTFAFLALAVYSCLLGQDQIQRDHMEPFFAGAIAFQMILSNVIWTLTDDVFIEGEKSLTKKS